MTESYLGDDDEGSQPDSFEGIIGSNFGNGNYVRAVVESSRTTQEEAADVIVAMWCHLSQSRSESLRQKRHRSKKSGRFIGIALGGSRDSLTK